LSWAEPPNLHPILPAPEATTQSGSVPRKHDYPDCNRDCGRFSSALVCDPLHVSSSAPVAPRSIYYVSRFTYTQPRLVRAGHVSCRRSVPHSRQPIQLGDDDNREIRDKCLQGKDRADEAQETGDDAYGTMTLPTCQMHARDEDHRMGLLRGRQRVTSVPD